MEHIISRYHKSIPLASHELYFAILKHRPSYSLRRDCGFPVTDVSSPNDQAVSCTPSSTFSNSPDPGKQQCKRCRKPLSLLQEGWYADERGCSYHPGRRVFDGGPENGLYSCCKRVADGDGCRHHACHVCDYRPLRSGAFVRPAVRAATPRWADAGNVFALDCEMVYTTAGMEVVRVSVVDVRGTALYDSLVVPGYPVLDFNTAYSGVKAEDLAGVATTLEDAQRSLLEFLDANSILIGHGLENDLLGLHLFHQNVVDTSLVFEHERGFPYRHSLKHLALTHLRKAIHCDAGGHNSVEDAKTSLALVLHKVFLENRTFRRNRCRPVAAQTCAPPRGNGFPTAQKPVFINIQVSGTFSDCPLCQNGAYPCVQGPIPYFVRLEGPRFPVIVTPW